MRIDKFLKVSRLIKRRTVANDACFGDRIKLNDKIAKPGDRIKPGDKIELMFGDRTISVEVLSVAETVKKEDADKMYRVL